MEYFDKINESCKMDFVVKRYDLNYYGHIKKISDNFGKRFNEVYNDLDNYEKYLSYIDKDDKKKTSEIIKGMLGLSKMVGGYIGNANRCLDYLAKSDRSKSGASDSDITKSARYVLSNKYFNKKDSIKIVEDYIKNGEKTAINGDPNKKSFMKEVMRSSESGYLSDVLLKVNYLDSGKKLTGKCGKVICSKEYNNYIASALTGSAGSNGNVDYGRIVSEGLRYVVIEVQKDLEYGIRYNDYILDKNKDNLIKFIADWS